MGGLGAWGALIQRGTQWADRGVDWAIYRKQRGDYASQVRHLRRREYQDMMYSMKAAGLNPILAAGASPGHSAAMMGHGVPAGSGVDVASAVSATAKADAAERQAGASERDVRVKEVKAPSEVGLNVINRFGIAQQLEQTAAMTAKIKADTELSLQESGTAATRRALMIAQAKQAGWSAKDLEEGINTKRGDPRNIVGRMATSARETDEQLGGWTGLGKSIAGSIGDLFQNAEKAAPKKGAY